MTVISIDPQQLMYAAKQYLATAHYLRTIARSLTTSPSYGIAPSIASRVASELPALAKRLESLAVDLESESHGLALIARFISEDQQGEATEVPLDFMHQLFGALSLVGRHAEKTGLSRAAAARQMMLNSSSLDDIVADLPAIAKSATAVGFVLTVYSNYRETGDPLESLARAGGSLAGGYVGGLGATAICGGIMGWTGFGLLLCVGAGGLVGGAVGDKAVGGFFNQTYLGPIKWRAAKAATVSGYLPIEEEVMDLDADRALLAARRLRAEEYVAAGYPAEEAERLVELEFPDLSEAQLGP